MRSSIRPHASLLFALVLVVALALGACGAPSVESARRSYSAEVTSFTVRDPAPVEPLAPMEDPSDGAALDSVDGEGTEAPPPDETGEAETGEADMDGANDGDDIEVEDLEMDSQLSGPEAVDVVLDILITHDGSDTLPGLTLDVFQGTADGDEKNRWTAWVDTSGMGREKRIAHTLRDVLYVQGDGFAAEVAHTVPKDERGEYREFAKGGAGN